MIIPLTITIPYTGLDLGYTVLDLDRAVFASFSTAGMVEVGNGVYAVAGGVVVPDGGGYVQVWTELDGDADEFIGEAAVEGGGGAGLYSETITVNDGDGNPVDGVLVQVATDSGFSSIVRSGSTNNLGQVTLHFDALGTYYGRAEIAGYGLATFTVEVTA